MNVVSSSLRYLKADVFHGRSGTVNNVFKYQVDQLLFRVDDPLPDTPKRLSFDGFNLWSVNHTHYGDGKRSLSQRAQDFKSQCGLTEVCEEVWLLTQPAFLGFSFNPVSFWFFIDGNGDLRAAVAEVNNVQRDRHCYLCAHGDLQPIRSEDNICVRKIFHVSPYQPIDGHYQFNIAFHPERIDLRIRYSSETDDGLTATLRGKPEPLIGKHITSSIFHTPLGALRVLGLIFWQAFKLKLKGAFYRRRPLPPSQELSS